MVTELLHLEDNIFSETSHSRWDGSPDWHLPNGFASWRNATHAFAFGGQQSGMALDDPQSKYDGMCNDAEGVL